MRKRLHELQHLVAELQDYCDVIIEKTTEVFLSYDEENKKLNKQIKILKERLNNENPL